MVRRSGSRLTASLVTPDSDIVEGVREFASVNLILEGSAVTRSESCERPYRRIDKAYVINLVCRHRRRDIEDSPTGPLPAAIRASLIKVIIDPTTGDDADVPKTSTNCPSIAKIDKFQY